MTDPLVARYGGWALVTGASSGIGECYARALAKRGFPVVLTARRQERLEALAGALRSEHGVDTHIVPLELAEPRATDRLMEEVGDRPVGVLVNNAGFGFSGPLLEVDKERYEGMVAVNCAAVTRLTYHCLPQMVERGRGAMFIISSVAAFQATPWFAVYGATKAYDLMFAEALASELVGSGVDVLAVCPGETKTEFSSQAHFAREPAGMSAESVVEGSLRRIGRSRVFVPGAPNKFVAFLHRLLPRNWVTDATGAVLAKELLRTSPSELRKRARNG